MAHNIDELRDYLQLLTKTALKGWCGQRALDCIGLAEFLPLDFIICCDYGQDISELENRIPVFSMEKKTLVRKNWSNSHLEQAFSREAGQQFKKFSGSAPRYFLCYRSIRHLENLQQQRPDQYNHVRLL